MLFSHNVSASSLPEALNAYKGVLCAPETVDENALAALITLARADITAQRSDALASPKVSACVLAAVMRGAAERDMARHLLSDGLSVLLYYANHDARGGLFGLVGTEMASKIGHVPPEVCDADAWTEAVATVTAAIAALTEALGYDDDLTENYLRRTALAKAYLAEQ